MIITKKIWDLGFEISDFGLILFFILKRLSNSKYSLKNYFSRNLRENPKSEILNPKSNHFLLTSMSGAFFFSLVAKMDFPSAE